MLRSRMKVSATVAASGSPIEKVSTSLFVAPLMQLECPTTVALLQLQRDEKDFEGLCIMVFSLSLVFALLRAIELFV